LQLRVPEIFSIVYFFPCRCYTQTTHWVFDQIYVVYEKLLKRFLRRKLKWLSRTSATPTWNHSKLQMKGSWDPPSNAKSVEALPQELFMECRRVEFARFGPPFLEASISCFGILSPPFLNRASSKEESKKSFTAHSTMRATLDGKRRIDVKPVFLESVYAKEWLLQVRLR
jgi:hypothetical protein